VYGIKLSTKRKGLQSLNQRCIAGDMDEIAVSTIGELIEKLGGPSKAAEILGATPQRVVNWRNRDQISATLFMQHQAILRERGLVVPPHFWRQGETA